MVDRGCADKLGAGNRQVNGRIRIANHANFHHACPETLFSQRGPLIGSQIQNKDQSKEIDRPEGPDALGLVFECRNQPIDISFVVEKICRYTNALGFLCDDYFFFGEVIGE